MMYLVEGQEKDIIVEDLDGAIHGCMGWVGTERASNDRLRVDDGGI
jgi:hypothetical protein